LGRGGAEHVLVGSVNELRNYNNVVVYLNSPHDLRSSINNALDVICLNHNSKFDLPATVLKLREIIQKYKADIVHSQLFWSTLVARLAKPRRVKLLFTLQNLLSRNTFGRSKMSLYVERATYHKDQGVIAVADEVLKDYDRYVGIKGEHHVLYNFIGDKFFRDTYKEFEPERRPIKMVAVGNLKDQKNYPYIIEAFKKIEDRQIILDIYGDGEQYDMLNQEIHQHNLSINLCGKVANLHELLPAYDLYVMCSKYEGCSLAVFEAMASGLPTMLSDKEEIREATGNNSIFFDLNDTDDFVQKLNQVTTGLIDINPIGRNGFEHVRKVAQKNNYVSHLNNIYETAL
jgi:glycosyltransferase involved in cell wall biosynthesis